MKSQKKQTILRTPAPQPVAPREGGIKKVPQQHTTEPLDEHLVSFLISQGHSRPRAQQDVARDPEGVKQLKRDYDEANKPQED